MAKELFFELVVLVTLAALEYLVAHRSMHVAARKKTKKQPPKQPRKPKRSAACVKLAQAFARRHKRLQHPNMLLIFPSASRLWVMSGVVATVPAVLFGHFHGFGVIQFVMDSGDSYDWGVIFALSAMSMVWLAVCVATNSVVSWLIVADALGVTAELEKAGNSVAARQEYSVTEVLARLPWAVKQVLALLPWAVKQERKERLAANGRETGVFAVMAFFEDVADGFVYLTSVEATD